MTKKHIISLSGELASGKGAVSSKLSEILSYSIYRNGAFFRQLAEEHNMSVTEFNEYCNTHPEIDYQIESNATKYSETHDNYIIDARMGWYSVKESFKVYLKVDIDEAARRAFNDKNRKNTENFSSIEEHKQDLIKRYQLENARYFELYNVHKEDESNYDLIIDTTDKTVEEVASIIIENYNKWLEE